MKGKLTLPPMGMDDLLTAAVKHIPDKLMARWLNKVHCGDCVDICPYIEMREREDRTVYACIDKALCLGCGACIPLCPTGAITQPRQSDMQIISTLRSVLQTSQVTSEV